MYIGAGWYPETVTLDTDGTSGSPIVWEGDIDGAQTGDPGPVIIAASDTVGATTSRFSCITGSGREWQTLRNLILLNGELRVGGSTTNGEGWVIEDCALLNGYTNDDDASSFALDYDQGGDPSQGVTWRRCVFAGRVYHPLDAGAAGADVDFDVSFENCIWIGNGGTAETESCLSVADLGGTNAPGGVTVTNCKFIAGSYGVYVWHGVSSTYPVDVQNCEFASQVTALYKATSNDGALTSDYNYTYMVNTAYVNVSAGANDKANNVGMYPRGGLGDNMFYAKLGWSPWLPWEPIADHGFTAYSALIGTGSSTPAPATDLYGNPRPMGPGTDNADDIGPVEARNRPQEETTTTDAGSGIVFTGAGYHDLFVPVDASATTITVKCRQDTTYAGTLPQMKVMNIDGVADITDTSTAADDAWDTLTSGSFTPDSAGIVRVRLISNDTSTAGECFFDTLTVS